MKVNRRVFMGASVCVGASVGAWAASGPISGRQSQGRPFCWKDAQRRVEVELAAVSEDGGSIVVQVTRPLAARGGGFVGHPWSLLDPRGALWLLDRDLGNPRELPVLAGGAWAPCFSPDGKRLAALTLVSPGKVGVAVWELASGKYQILSNANVEVLLPRFRTHEAAYQGPTQFYEMPRQYVWLGSSDLVLVDYGPSEQQLLLATSGLSTSVEVKRLRTEKGMRSVRVWDEGSPTCGAASRLVRMSCDTGGCEVLYEGDVRGVSLSPGGVEAALLVAAANVPPVPDRPMSWPLLPLTGIDDAMVALKLVLISLTGTARARQIPEFRAVGEAAPSRLPRWSGDGSRVAVPARTTYSDAPVTGNDCVWEVTVATGAARQRSASSALDAELLTALLTTEGCNAERVIERRPVSLRVDNYTLAGQIKGGAWQCSKGRVMLWNSPELSLISPTGTELVGSSFVSVQPPVTHDSYCRSILVRADHENCLMTVSADGYQLESLPTRSDWTLLAVSAHTGAALYKEDSSSGTFLIRALTTRRARRSPLEFNTYFSEVRVPTRRTMNCKFVDGSVRTGLLQLPISHQAGDHHPVIVWAYPNAAPTMHDAFTRANSPINVIYPIQYLLTKGFAVFQAPFPIRGQQSVHPMRAAAEAVIPWLDLLAKDPDIIPGEYGFFGHSNAGYVALALEALSSRFKAIVAWDTFPEIGYDTLHSYAEDVAMSCAANLVQGFRMFYEDPRQPYAPEPAPPWKRPLEYIKSDPVFNLGQARTPLLLVEGEFDVSPKEMEEVYSILYGRGIPVELAYYWGEGHVFGSPGNIRDCWLRTEEFLKSYLQIS